MVDANGDQTMDIITWFRALKAKTKNGQSRLSMQSSSYPAAADRDVSCALADCVWPRSHHCHADNEFMTELSVSDLGLETKASAGCESCAVLLKHLEHQMQAISSELPNASLRGRLWESIITFDEQGLAEVRRGMIGPNDWLLKHMTARLELCAQRGTKVQPHGYSRG